MIKSALCKGLEETTKFLNSMQDLGYDVHSHIERITKNRSHYTIFYNYIEKFGEPSLH